MRTQTTMTTDPRPPNSGAHPDHANTEDCSSDRPYLVATFANRPGFEIPLLSNAECEARGIEKPTGGLLDHLTPERRLEVLEPLIALIAENIVRDLSDEASGTAER